MKKSYLFVFIICTFCLSITSCSNRKEGVNPEAKKGVIDLSGIDFCNNEKINLSGEWEFYWKKLYTPLDFDNELIANKEFNKVPLNWDKYEGSKHFGFATYRLKIITKNNVDCYGIKLPVIYTSYNIWINDKKMISNGLVGNSKVTSKPRENTDEIFFSIDKDFFYLTIQVSNYSDISNGICFPIMLGTAKEIAIIKRNKNLKEGIILGSIIIMALYHFGLFIQRKNNKSTIYFSLFCLFLAIRVILVGEHYFSDLFPDINYQFQKKIEFIVAYLGLLTFILFFQSEFYKEVNKNITKTINIIILLLSSFVILFPLAIYVRFLFIYQILAVLTGIYFLGILFIAIFNKNKKAGIFTVGILFLFFTFILEIMHINFLINGFYLMPVGVCMFIFVQSYLLSISFSDSFREKEKLAKKLQNSNKILESKVKARTIELEKANLAKTDFFVNIAHETRTPLTLISNYIEKISGKYSNDKEVDIVKFHIRQLTRNTVNFLDFEALQKGKIIYNHNQRANISEILRIQMEIFKEYARLSKVLIKCDIEQNLAVKIDPVAIERILNNLAQNAIKYSRNRTSDFKPEINIELNEINNNTVRLQVKDNGIGIAPEKIPHIFDPYYQVCNEKSNIQGIGMGLNIVKKVVDSFNGSIEVSSIPNTGTTFCITFKKLMEYEQSDYIEQLNTQNIVGRTFFNIKPYIIENFTVEYIKGRNNIFIIEDNEEMLLYLAENLKNKYNIFYAINGQDALKKIDDYPIIDLILSDIMMDKMNGYDFYENLRKKKDYTYTPFIFITARTVKNEKIQSLKDGALDYINKPFAIDELKAKIDSIINNTEAQKSKNINEFESRILNSLNNKENKKLNSNKIISIIDKKSLSTREKEVLLLLKEGYKNQEICDQLYISLSTVKKHIQNIYKKCNVTNRHDLLQLVS